MIGICSGVQAAGLLQAFSTSLERTTQYVVKGKLFRHLADKVRTLSVTVFSVCQRSLIFEL